MSESNSNTHLTTRYPLRYRTAVSTANFVTTNSSSPFATSTTVKFSIVVIVVEEEGKKTYNSMRFILLILTIQLRENVTNSEVVIAGDVAEDCENVLNVDDDDGHATCSVCLRGRAFTRPPLFAYNVHEPVVWAYSPTTAHSWQTVRWCVSDDDGGVRERVLRLHVGLRLGIDLACGGFCRRSSRDVVCSSSSE